MKDTIINIISTVVGGIILAIIFFIWNDFYFKPDNLSGCWIATYTIEKTDYIPYNNLIIEYEVHILQVGNQLTGNAEKIREQNSKGNIKEYIGDSRTVASIKGGLDNNYLSKDQLNLNIVENGKKRESTAILNLIVESADTIEGEFFSTAANSYGHTKWQRKKKAL